jgi:hypothetical protein
MPAKQYIVSLTGDERQSLEKLTKQVKLLPPKLITLISCLKQM